MLGLAVEFAGVAKEVSVGVIGTDIGTFHRFEKEFLRFFPFFTRAYPEPQRMGYLHGGFLVAAIISFHI